MVNIATLKDQLLETAFVSADDLARRSKASQRCANDINRQLNVIGRHLSKKDHATLTEAAKILSDISTASLRAKQAKAKQAAAQEARRKLAMESLTHAFADVIDPAGVVALLATTGSYRTLHTSTRPLPSKYDFDDYDIKSIMGRERNEALDQFEGWQGIVTNTARSSLTG